MQIEVAYAHRVSNVDGKGTQDWTSGVCELTCTLYRWQSARFVNKANIMSIELAWYQDVNKTEVGSGVEG
jgi:hypothetical protein